MKFEVINDKGITVMQTTTKSCIPDEEQLSYMSKAGYKFKLGGKVVTLKKIKEYQKEKQNAEDSN